MDQASEVKQKVDIVSIIGERIEIKKAGRNFKANCPFHGEKTPSFVVSPELQIYKCFGCSESGDVFTFLEKFEGMDFPEALKYLADRVGVKLTSFRGTDSGVKELMFEINKAAAQFYHYMLLKHDLGKNALKYLTIERGITKESVETFGIGFSPQNSSLIRNFLINKKKFGVQDLEKAGIIVRGQYDRFSGRLIFPIIDHRGNNVAFSGRLLPGSREDMAKYINSPETPVYVKGNMLYGLNLTREFVKKKKVAIVVEGELDLISSWQVGVKNVVAIKGSALTSEQVVLLSRFAEKLILTLDADLAGNEAARRGIKIAQQKGFEVRVAGLSPYKDPDEAARGDSAVYKKALIGAVPVWDFLINFVFSKFDTTTGEGKAKISREIVPILSDIDDKIVQAHYISIVATKLAVSESAVESEIRGVPSVNKTAVNVSTQTKEEKNRRMLLEERLISLLFRIDPKRILETSVLEIVTTPLAKRIVDEFKKYGNKESFDISSFSKFLPRELEKGFSEMILSDVEEVEGEEIDLVLTEIKSLEIRNKLERLGVSIRKYESEGDFEKLKEAQISFGELSKKLSDLEHNAKKGIILL